MTWGSGIYNSNRVTNVNQISGNDLLALFIQQNGGNSSCSLTLFADWLSSHITVEGDGKVTQYAAPSATDFTVTILNGSSSIWLILTPTGTFNDGTILMPAIANVVDKQELLLNCTQEVTNLVVDGNGATVTGAPSALGANDVFTLRYDAVLTTWFCVN